jgi:catechol 2,3-dioxygenase-like lactoylglutathione lyase family enzyme
MTNPWPRALTHVGVTVTDLDKAVRWYGEILGFHVIAGPAELVGDDSPFGQIVKDIFGADFGRGRLVFLTGGNGVVIEIFEFERPKSERRENNFEFWKNGFFHICFVDPDIEETAKKIAETGGKLRSKVWQLFPDKPYKIAYCEDPFGNTIELYSHSTEQTWSNR